MPNDGTYFEPFVGGGAVLGALGPRTSFAGDVIPELIEFWLAVKLRPSHMADAYEVDWNLLQSRGHLHFYEVRDRFNELRKPEDLLFISRTCVNGLIRFNKNGEFNNSFHHSRPGISPRRLRKVLDEWSLRVSKTEFVAGDYEITLDSAQPGDIIYFDPPYASTRGRYQNGNELDLDRFWSNLDRLTQRGILWVLSFDGRAGSRDYSDVLEIPRQLSAVNLAMEVGSSPFPRVMNGRVDGVVESVFLNYDPHERLGTKLFEVAG